jgi:hypothetical protein
METGFTPGTRCVGEFPNMHIREETLKLCYDARICANQNVRRNSPRKSQQYGIFAGNLRKDLG